MANQLLVHLNISNILKDGSSMLEIAVDGMTIGRIQSSQSFFIPDGMHNIYLRFCYYCNNGGGFITDKAISSNTQCVIDGDDYEITVNAYHVGEHGVEFHEGFVPLDPAKSKPKGCYVATCVYGSYDCPQVWTLRRYRDDTLGVTWYGRLFIRTYYAISPTLVKWFGHTNWFKKMWKGKLDRMVAKLQSEGVENTPYDDQNW